MEKKSWLTKLKERFDWFEQCKVWMILQGASIATSIGAFYLIYIDSDYKWYALAYFVIAQVFEFICAKITNKLYAQNNKVLNIKLDSK